MKVRARQNVKCNGVWRRPGEVFEISTMDSDVMEYVDVMETPLRELDSDETVEAPKRRGRPRRTDADGE